MPISPIESLNAFGNSSHLDNFLRIYEARIEKEGELQKPITEAPNYYAWIYFSSERMFYQIRKTLYINTEDHAFFDASYSKLLNDLFTKYNLDQEQIDSILIFAKIRHLIVHKGFPNSHVAALERKNNEVAKGYPFTAEEVEYLAQKLYSPKFYIEFRQHYRNAMSAIDSFENDFTHNFGSFQISRKRNLE